MIVTVTLQNKQGGKYKVKGQLVSIDKQGITLKQSTGKSRNYLMNYYDEIIEIVQYGSLKGGELNDIRLNNM